MGTLNERHAIGVTHGDIRFGNIVAVNGKVTLIDFGKAEVTNQAVEEEDAEAECAMLLELFRQQAASTSNLFCCM